MYTLLIGNGFDLAHKLPTNYTDFMNYLDAVHYVWQHHEKIGKICIDEEIKNNIRKRNLNPLLEQTLLQTPETLQTRGILRKYNVGKDYLLNVFANIFRPVDHNYWYYYFQKVLQENDHWMGFESTIADVMKVFSKLDERDQYKFDGENSFELDFYECFKEKNLISFILKNIDKISNVLHKSDFEDAMIKSLSKIMKAMENYMVLVDNMPICVESPDIKSYHFDNIISFNYTNTFKRVYNPNLEDNKICFLHGKADGVNHDSSNNIVLGINNSLSQYGKIFQKIYKNTDINYKKFLQGKEKEKCVLVIFGHSLSQIDGDIIKDLINSYDSTTVYYNTDKQHQQQIENLLSMFKSTLETYMSSGKIKIKRQNEMCNRR